MKQKSAQRREHVDADSNVKRLVDRRIAKSLQDYKGGRLYGPFGSAEAMVQSLRGKPAKAIKHS